MNDQNYNEDEAYRAAVKEEMERLRKLLRNEQKYHEIAQQELKQYQLCIQEIVNAVNKYKLKDF